MGALAIREPWQSGSPGNKGGLATREAWQQGRPGNKGGLATREGYLYRSAGAA
jgi:hypothetical protein